MQHQRAGRSWRRNVCMHMYVYMHMYPATYPSVLVGPGASLPRIPSTATPRWPPLSLPGSSRQRSSPVSSRSGPHLAWPASRRSAGPARSATPALRAHCGRPTPPGLYIVRVSSAHSSISVHLASARPLTRRAPGLSVLHHAAPYPLMSLLSSDAVRADLRATPGLIGTLFSAGRCLQLS